MPAVSFRCQLIPVYRDALRRAIAILLACTVMFLGLSQGLTVAHAEPPHSLAASQHLHWSGPTTTDGTGGGELPLHLKMGCVSDLGCLLMVGIPAMPHQVSQPFSWAPVSYWARHPLVQGITAEPSLDPPIV